MKAIVVAEFGNPDVLTLSQRPVPAPGAGQVLITVQAAGVGLVDVLARRGLYPGHPEAGFTPGVEVAGIVTKAGDEADAHWIGKRVFALSGANGYAQQVVLPVGAMVPLPDGLAATDAIAIGVNALTAAFSVERACIRAGESVLVRGASGGVGSAMVQAAALAGGRVTASSGSTGRSAALLALGAKALVGRSPAPDAHYDVILDPVAGPDVGAFMGMLEPNGRYILCGAAAGMPPADFGWSMVIGFANSPTVSALSLNSIAPAQLVTTASRLFADAARGARKPEIAATYPLADAAAAHRALESGAMWGKLILVPEA